MPELNFNVLARQGPSGVLQGFQQGQELRNQMVRQNQQEQLADLQMQNALREQRMAGEEEAAYKAAGSDMGRLQQELMQRGLGKQSMAVGAQLAKQQTDKMAMLEQQHKLIKSAAAQVFANPENAIQTLTAFGQRTGIDMNDDLAQIQAIVNDPAKIKQWAAGIAIEADKLLPKFQQFDQGGAVITGAVDPLTGQFRQGTAYQKSMAPGEAEKIAISRGQLGVAQARLAFEKANPGMEIKEGPNGEMLAINKRTGAAQPVMMNGAAVTGGGKPLTESQAKAGKFSILMNNAFEAADKLEKSAGLGGRLLAGNSFTNFMAPEVAQQYEQAKRNWVAANLRQESGAVIGADEMAQELKRYFPVAGDGPKQIEQKRQARLDAMAGMEAIAGESGVKTVQKSRKALEDRYPSKQAPVAQTPASKPPAGIDAAIWNVMTPQERALWQK